MKNAAEMNNLDLVYAATAAYVDEYNAMLNDDDTAGDAATARRQAYETEARNRLPVMSGHQESIEELAGLRIREEILGSEVTVNLDNFAMTIAAAMN